MKPLRIVVSRRFDMNYIKGILKALGGSLKSSLLKQVDELDKYQPALRDLIAKNADPDIISKKVIEMAKDKLKQAINKTI
jgi:hypothetical protein